jgi:hypothetical protein
MTNKKTRPRSDWEQQQVDLFREWVLDKLLPLRKQTGDETLGTRARPITSAKAWEMLLGCGPLYREAQELAPVLLRINTGKDAGASMIVDQETAKDPGLARRRRESRSSDASTHYGVIVLDASDIAVPFALSTIVEAEMGFVIWPEEDPEWWPERLRRAA